MMLFMDDSIKKILEIVTETQEGVVSLQKDVSEMRKEIDANTKAIAQMAEELRSVFGYAKEIDALMTRMSAVEKHVGISK